MENEEEISEKEESNNDGNYSQILSSCSSSYSDEIPVFLRKDKTGRTRSRHRNTFHLNAKNVRMMQV